MSQGATGEISSGFERSPRNSDEELEMERTVGNARGKGLIDYDSSKDEVQVVAPTKKGKEKKRSAKHKPTDLDINSQIPSPSSGTATRYFRMLDSLESLVMKKRSTSTTSVSSPSKDSGGKFDFEKEYCLALAQLTELKLNWNEHMKVADVLKDTTELIIWMTARSDEDRRDFARMRGCI